jgi:hypothetical protein
MGPGEMRREVKGEAPGVQVGQEALGWVLGWGSWEAGRVGDRASAESPEEPLWGP